jgi:ubiquinone biosynthesis protein Coq4
MEEHYEYRVRTSAAHERQGSARGKHHISRETDFFNSKVFQTTFFKHDIHHMVTGFGTDLIGELKLLCWEVGAGTPSYYAEKYIKFPLVFLFRPLVSMKAYKLGKTQHSLFDLDEELLGSKTLQEVVH